MYIILIRTADGPFYYEGGHSASELRRDAKQYPRLGAAESVAHKLRQRRAFAGDEGASYQVVPLNMKGVMRDCIGDLEAVPDEDIGYYRAVCGGRYEVMQDVMYNIISYCEHWDMDDPQAPNAMDSDAIY